MEADYDLIIAGGGPAGSAAAITAARKGARVLLLREPAPPRDGNRLCRILSARAQLALRVRAPAPGDSAVVERAAV